jgi:peptidoglycan glycosyltransferase
VNSAIRRLSVIVLVMFLALMASATWVQFFDAGSLNADARNRRTLYREYGTFRGPIVVDGQAIASSFPVKDPFGYQRAYADGWLYAPVTGFYSVVYGRTGIEQAENTLLNGTDDSLFWTRLGDLLAGKEQTGATVELTLRSELQQVASEALGAQRGAVVALDPRTGEILAMVTSPSYDPNRLAGHTTADVVETYRGLDADPARPLINRAIAGDTYAPGSLFKLVTTATALENGYDPETLVYAPVELALPFTETTIKNFGDEPCGPDETPTLAYALQHSCNTAFADLAMNLGWGALERKAGEFGWGDSISIPLPVTPSRLPTRPDAAHTAMSGIGQYDVRATPLQMAMIGSAIANDGILMRPYLVADSRDSNLQILSVARPEVYGTPMSAETASQLRDMMIAVVEGGTGTAARIPGVPVAGKTGTAESGSDAAPHAWFLGFAPADNPVVVVIVIVENGGNAGSEATGGTVAAPIARTVILKAIELDQQRKDRGLE